jgi:cytochrome c biogenesis protein
VSLAIDTDRQAPVGPPELGWRGSARWLWRQLTSMRTALVLLLLLAVATIPGSLFPQRAVDRGAVEDYLAENPGTGPWLDRLGFFDVYASPWFAAVYLLLFVSLVGCIVPRARSHAREWRRRPPAPPRRFSRMPAHRVVEVDEPADVVLARLHAALARPGWRGGGGPLLGHAVDEHMDEHPDEHLDVRPQDQRATGPVRALAAETGRLRETGNLLFHVSLIGVLLALATGSLYAYRGEALVVEGASFSNVRPAYDSITPGARFDADRLEPFSFRLDALDVAFEEDQLSDLGAPRDFEATVTWTESPGAEARPGTVRVNEPLHIGDSSIYLTGNGYAPVVEVRDGDGEVRWSGPVPFLPQDGSYTSTGVVKAPVPGGDDIGLTGYLLPTADPTGRPLSIFPDARDPRLVLTAFTGDIGLGRTPQSVYELDTTDMTQLTGEDGAPVVLALSPGEQAELPDGAGSVTFVDLPRFAAFQVRSDPSGPLALVSSVLAMVGLVASLFLPRRRVWVRVAPAPGGDGAGRTVVEVAALSRSRDTGLQAEVDRLAAVAGTDQHTTDQHQTDQHQTDQHHPTSTTSEDR